MAGQESKGSAASLIESVLAQVQQEPAAQPQDALADSPPDPRVPAEQEIATLIDVYFELEDPLERDALMERLDAIDHPLVTDFLLAMMRDDEDDVVRAEAAARLARRHNDDAIELLQADFDDPPEPYFFENAVRALCQVRGVTFYDELKRVWLDADRDADQKREAMLGMESLDLQRAFNDLFELVDSSTDIDALPEDQLELAMMIFARHDCREAIPHLQRLQEHIRAADLEAGERQALLDFVQEGVDLLRAD